MSDLGFVTVEDIANVMEDAKTKLEAELVYAFGPTYPKPMMAIFEGAQHELYKRAKATLEETIRRNPGALKDPKKERDAAAEAQETARNRETWDAKKERNRAAAIAEALRSK